MEKLVAVILAAGKGTRMKSETVKVLHPVAGRPMLAYPIQAAAAAGCDEIVVVIGHQRGEVEAALQDTGVVFAHQDRQLGSGHAVAVTEGLLKGFDGDVLILCGDVPLIRPETIQNFLSAHRGSGAVVSVLSVVLDDPSGYGRIVRDGAGRLLKIVEHRDATEEQRAVREINTGIYCCRSRFLFDALKRVGTDNDQGEYYLPDIVSIGVAEGHCVQAVETGGFEEVRGINDREDLAEAEAAMRRRILAAHMQNGVTLIDPNATYIEAEVAVGSDTVIYPGCLLRGSTTIGTGCLIEANCVVTGSVIGNRVHLKPACVLDESQVKDGAAIGPFAHLRPQAVVEAGARVGNFVEIKKSTIGRGSKASHLTYIGDATIGAGVNVGAGTITCNYDGKHKHPTVIGDGAFIGSNTALVAPVRLGKHSVVGAGSTITRDVPDYALAVTRARQKSYDHFVQPDKEGEKE